MSMARTAAEEFLNGSHGTEDPTTEVNPEILKIKAVAFPQDFLIPADLLHIGRVSNCSDMPRYGPKWGVR